MAHTDHHPDYVDGCFGCKVASIGYDGKHTTRLIKDENGAVIRKYRNGRQDVTVTPKTAVGIRLKANSE